MASDEQAPLTFNGGYIALPPLPSRGGKSPAPRDGGSTCGADSEITEGVCMHTPRTDGSPPESAKKQKTWHVPMSLKAQRTTNPIRAIMEKITSQKRDPIPGKPQIPLSLGDPTAFGNLQAPEVLNETMISLIRDAKSNGYGASSQIFLRMGGYYAAPLRASWR